jgi:hypothetical protein
MSDICANRHQGNAESSAANKRVAPKKADLREMLRQWFVFRGSAGGTCEEASVALGMRYTTCSARISELKADKTLVGVLSADGKQVRKKTSGGSSAAVLRAQTPAERHGDFAIETQTRLFA